MGSGKDEPTYRVGHKLATRACDQCRFRKTKCLASQPCISCLTLGLECTFLRPQKKRGRAGKRLAQLRRHEDSPRPSSHSDTAIGAIPSIHLTPCSKLGSQIPSLTVDEIEPGYDEIRPVLEYENLSPILAAIEHKNVNPTPSDIGFEVQEHSSLGDDNRAMDKASQHDVGYWEPDIGPEDWMSQPGFEYVNSDLSVAEYLPSIVTAKSPVNVRVEPRLHNTSNSQDQIWPSHILEHNLIPWIDVFFDRFYANLPILSRTVLFTKMIAGEHRRNPQFGSMILSLCAFALIQPIDDPDQVVSSSRVKQAETLVNEATKLRESSVFGENPTIDSVLTGFFLFAYLFGRNQRNAAQIRLRETVDLGSILGIHDFNMYASLSDEEKTQWYRTFRLLSVTERAYALQRRWSITLAAKSTIRLERSERMSYDEGTWSRSRFNTHNEIEASSILNLTLLTELFDPIDQNIIRCWSGVCDIQEDGCHDLDKSKILAAHLALTRIGNDFGKCFGRSQTGTNKPNDLDGANRSHETQPWPATLSETQRANLLITRKWLQNRLWNLTMSHGLLEMSSEYAQLSSEYAFQLATEKLDLCCSVRVNTMEAMGLIEKLYDIIVSAISMPEFYQGTSESPAAANCYSDPFYRIADNLAPNHDSHFRPNGPTGFNLSLVMLARNYLKLLQTLRKGNHPFMEKYEMQVVSLGLI